jgi:membrane protein
MVPRIPQRLREGLPVEAGWQRLEQIASTRTAAYIRRAVNGFNNHNDLLWASGLTYTTSLSIVPTLAVALSTLKSLGGTESIRPLIRTYLAVDSPQITDEIMRFVGNINARTLGTVGGVTLLVTVVLTLSTVEAALNNIFNVAHGRTLVRQFTDYLSLVFTVPVLLAAAIPLKNNFQAALPDYQVVGWIVATIPIWAGFSFLYLFFPNRPVRWNFAAIGGLFAAILFEIGQWTYIRFQLGVGRYQEIYGALAAVPVLLTWIYIAWVIVLAGGELAAALQGTEASYGMDYRSLSFLRTVALLVVARAGERMQGRRQNCTAQSLAAEVGAPEPSVKQIVDRLVAAGLVHEVGERDPALAKEPEIYLSRDSSDLPIRRVLEAIDEGGGKLDCGTTVETLLENLRNAEQRATDSITVRDLIEGRSDIRPSGHTQSQRRG